MPAAPQLLAGVLAKYQAAAHVVPCCACCARCAPQHLVGVLAEYKAAGASAQPALARKMDGALLAIGTLADVLKDKKRQVQFRENRCALTIGMSPTLWD